MMNRVEMNENMMDKINGGFIVQTIDDDYVIDDTGSHIGTAYTWKEALKIATTI